MEWVGARRGGITPPLPWSGALPIGAGSALLFALALPPHPVPTLLIPAFLLLAEALRRIPRGRAGLRSSALLGAIFGGFHSFLVLHWLPSAGWSHLGPIAIAAALGVWGLHAVMGMLVLGAVVASRLPLPLALMSGWAVLAWLPGSIPFLGVPWPGPELTLVEWPRAAALLPLLGSVGVGALMAGSAAGLLALGRVGVGVALLLSVLWGFLENGDESAGPGWPGPGNRDEAGPRVVLVEMSFPPSVVQNPEERELRVLAAMSRLALEFTILTAARTGEVIHARWDEIDTDKALWIVPADRMKAGKEHRVPLSDRAIEILATIKPITEAGGWLFEGQRPLKPMSNMAMLKLLERLKVPVTVHGFRSTFRDWCGETTGFPHAAIEKCLAHEVASAVERAYARSDLLDKRREIMAAWAAYALSAANTVGNVISLGAR